MYGVIMSYHVICWRCPLLSAWHHHCKSRRQPFIRYYHIWHDMVRYTIHYCDIIRVIYGNILSWSWGVCSTTWVVLWPQRSWSYMVISYHDAALSPRVVVAGVESRGGYNYDYSWHALQMFQMGKAQIKVVWFVMKMMIVMTRGLAISHVCYDMMLPYMVLYGMIWQGD